MRTTSLRPTYHQPPIAGAATKQALQAARPRETRDDVSMITRRGKNAEAFRKAMTVDPARRLPSADELRAADDLLNALFGNGSNEDHLRKLNDLRKKADSDPVGTRDDLKRRLSAKYPALGDADADKIVDGLFDVASSIGVFAAAGVAAASLVAAGPFVVIGIAGAGALAAGLLIGRGIIDIVEGAGGQPREILNKMTDHPATGPLDHSSRLSRSEVDHDHAIVARAIDDRESSGGDDVPEGRVEIGPIEMGEIVHDDSDAGHTLEPGIPDVIAEFRKNDEEAARQDATLNDPSRSIERLNENTTTPGGNPVVNPAEIDHVNTGGVIGQPPQGKGYVNPTGEGSAWSDARAYELIDRNPFADPETIRPTGEERPPRSELPRSPIPFPSVIRG